MRMSHFYRHMNSMFNLKTSSALDSLVIFEARDIKLMAQPF